MNRIVGTIWVVVISFAVMHFALIEYRKYALFNDGLLHVYFLNIGQGDSFLIKTPDKKLFLIDGGPNETVLFRLNKILPFWINRLDKVLISHFHRDHYMGIYYVKEFLMIGEILYPNQFESDEELFSLFDHFEPRGKNSSKYSLINKNEEHLLGDQVVLDIYSVDLGVKPISENFKSLIALVDYKDFEVLFTGDAPPSVQKAAQAYLPSNQIEILKVPHQGSKYDLSPPFISYLSPKEAIISVGKNTYGHPHKEVLDYYRQVGIPIHRTDSSMDYILLKSDGVGYEIIYN